MKTKPESGELIASLRKLSLAEVEQRIADLDAERAALSLLRRSLAARDRVKRKNARHAVTETEGGHRA